MECQIPTEKLLMEENGVIRVTVRDALSILGANLYFIFIAKISKIDEYLDYQYGILDNIQKYGAAMSHHHGIGKMTALWLEDQIGKNQLEVFRALKRHFDPNNIMNPGGTIALDLQDKDKRVRKF